MLLSFNWFPVHLSWKVYQWQHQLVFNSDPSIYLSWILKCFHRPGKHAPTGLSTCTASQVEKSGTWCQIPLFPITFPCHSFCHSCQYQFFITSTNIIHNQTPRAKSCRWRDFHHTVTWKSWPQPSKISLPRLRCHSSVDRRNMQIVSPPWTTRSCHRYEGDRTFFSSL